MGTISVTYVEDEHGDHRDYDSNSDIDPDSTNYIYGQILRVHVMARPLILDRNPRVFNARASRDMYI